MLPTGSTLELSARMVGSRPGVRPEPSVLMTPSTVFCRLSRMLLIGLVVGLSTGLPGVSLPWLDAPPSPVALESLASVSAAAIAPPLAPKKRPVQSTQTPAAKRTYDETTMSPHGPKVMSQQYYVATLSH
jgi:hypothetical protein